MANSWSFGHAIEKSVDSIETSMIFSVLWPVINIQLSGYKFPHRGKKKNPWRCLFHSFYTPRHNTCPELDECPQNTFPGICAFLYWKGERKNASSPSGSLRRTQKGRGAPTACLSSGQSLCDSQATGELQCWTPSLQGRAHHLQRTEDRDTWSQEESKGSLLVETVGYNLFKAYAALAI